MNIGEAAKLSGLNSKTIRYYEEIGLVTPMRQSGNDYRDYSDVDVAHLRFLQHSREVGFNLQECRELLDLYRNPERRSAQVKQCVVDKMKQLEERVRIINSMHATLTDMAERCAGNQDPECPIINELARPHLVLKSPNTMPFTLIENHGNDR